VEVYRLCLESCNLSTVEVQIGVRKENFGFDLREKERYLSVKYIRFGRNNLNFD